MKILFDHKCTTANKNIYKLSNAKLKHFTKCFGNIYSGLGPCERQNIPNFVFSQNSKHRIFRIFQKYKINWDKIVFHKTQNYSKTQRQDQKRTF